MKLCLSLLDVSILGGALGLRLPGFDANKRVDGNNQVVDILVDGKERQIEPFRECVETNRPSGAEVSNISVSDYKGDGLHEWPGG